MMAATFGRKLFEMRSTPDSPRDTEIDCRSREICTEVEFREGAPRGASSLGSRRWLSSVQGRGGRGGCLLWHIDIRCRAKDGADRAH